MVILMFYLVKFYTDDLEDLKNKVFHCVNPYQKNGKNLSMCIFAYMHMI